MFEAKWRPRTRPLALGLIIIITYSTSIYFAHCEKFDIKKTYLR